MNDNLEFPEDYVFSKKEINKAGMQLMQNINADNLIAYQTIDQWRSYHLYALNQAYKIVKRKVDQLGNHVIYGRRLKRMVSILNKLQRFNGMQLGRMQDIGGCRVILQNSKQLQRLQFNLEDCKSIELQKNYIFQPKPDGYRGIHLKYTLQSKHPQYNGLTIEIQLRTELQHAWATTLEIIDLFGGERLKDGQGAKNWQRFFYLMAEHFASLEQLPLYDASMNSVQRISEIKVLCNQLDVLSKLAIYIQILDNKVFCNQLDTLSEKVVFMDVLDNLYESKQIVKIATYWVLEVFLQPTILNPSNTAKEKTYSINIKANCFKDEKQAQVYHQQQEKCINMSFFNIDIIQQTTPYLINVLFVKSNSIKELKASYPNYFADSDLFVKHLNTILTTK